MSTHAHNANNATIKTKQKFLLYSANDRLSAVNGKQVTIQYMQMHTEMDRDGVAQW